MSKDVFQSVPEYDEVHFGTYISLLKAACLNPNSEDLLGDDDPDDPITVFLEENQPVKTALLAGNFPCAKQNFRSDPLLNGKIVLNEIKRTFATSQARIKLFKELQKTWKEWKSGEMHIYKTISRSISKHGWLLTGIPFGAGIALLAHIQDYNSRTKTRENTATLLKALDNFLHDGKESLAKYKARLLELKTDLANATTPEVISDERALFAYTKGLQHLDLYQHPIELLHLQPDMNLEKAHKFLLKFENRMAKHILQHFSGSSSASIALSNASTSPPPDEKNTDPDNSDNQSKPDCRYFIMNGRCRFGNKCKFNHPKGYEVGGKFRPKRKRERNHNRNGHENKRRHNRRNRKRVRMCDYILDGELCPFGHECKFLHKLPDNKQDARRQRAATQLRRARTVQLDDASESEYVAPPIKITKGDLTRGEVASGLFMVRAGRKRCQRDRMVTAILDGGASHHCTPHRRLLVNLRVSKVNLVEGSHGTTKGRMYEGDMRVGKYLLKGVLLVKECPYTLVSERKLMQLTDACILKKNDEVFLVDDDSNRTRIATLGHLGLYEMLDKPQAPVYASILPLSARHAIIREKVNRLHRKLGHLSANKMKIVLSRKSIDRLYPRHVDLLDKCDACIQAGSTSLPNKKEAKRKPTRFAQHLQADHTGIQPVKTFGGGSYGDVVVDRWSNWVWGVPVKALAQGMNHLKYVIEQECHGKVEQLRTDQGTEYVNYHLGALMQKVGCVHQTSNAYDHSQNGAAESNIRWLWEGIRKCLIDTGLPLKYWGEALHYCVFMHNRSPCYSNPDCKTPFEMRYGVPPDVKRLHMFGEKCYVHIDKELQPHKLASRAKLGMLLGYEDPFGTKGYRVWLVDEKKLVISKNVEFMGTVFRRGDFQRATPDVSSLFTEILRRGSLEPGAPPTPRNPPAATTTTGVPTTPNLSTTGVASSSLPTSLRPTAPTALTASLSPPSTVQSTTAPVTRIMTGKRKRQDYAEMASGKKASLKAIRALARQREQSIRELTEKEEKQTARLLLQMVMNKGEIKASTINIPKGYDAAVKSDMAEGWLGAISEENENMRVKKTYEKVNIEDLPKGANIVSCRWVFDAKTLGNGDLERLKARIVARGFEGIKGLDYLETYSPVASHATIRLFFVLAVQLGLRIKYIDFKAAYLNSETGNVRIYVKPPKGADCGPDQVWRLRKFLYGLKSSGRHWYKTLVKLLTRLGYTQSQADPCLFYRINGGKTSIIITVVDDLLVASSDSSINDKLYAELKKVYTVKDLGTPEYFIGVNVDVKSRHHVELHQELYINNLAQRFGQQNCRPVYSPHIKDHKLKRDDGSGPTSKPYRELIGALLYCGITRPDIAVIVSELSKFMSCPSHAHWNAAIRVLRYLKATASLRLVYKRDGSKVGFEAYGDASFDTCPDTSRSRTGVVLMINGCPFLWLSKMQPIVALSSAEAEYIAICDTGKEVVWARKLLQELGLLKPRPTIVHIDNQAAICMTANTMLKARTKHILRRYNWSREQVRNGVLAIVKIRSEDNISDFFTKNLGKHLFRKFRSVFLA